mmetsp:Transcript_19395/g.40907  ORF Transcript_19395/g.40907 Transcript_19395/m.40907 type:complete len:184 (+) Transcript_19395:47-598(+)
MKFERLFQFVVCSSSSIIPILAFRSCPFPVSTCLRLPTAPYFNRQIVTMAETQAQACTPGGKCIPCESLDKSHLLTAEAIEAELKGMKLWGLKDGNKISRSYTARNFQCAMDNLVDIGKIAERENHHPDMHLTGYRNVEIVLFTHSLDGISANDIIVAKMIDAEVEFYYSPKWLKSHQEAKKE